MSYMPYCNPTADNASQEHWPTFPNEFNSSAQLQKLSSSIQPVYNSFAQIGIPSTCRYLTATESILCSDAARAVGVADEPFNTLTMTSMESPVDALAQFMDTMNTSMMDIDIPTPIDEPQIDLTAVLPLSFRPSQLQCSAAQLSEVVQALQKAFRAAEKTVGNASRSLQEHALHSLICLSMHRLSREGFNSLEHLIVAIALDYLRSDPDLVLAAWRKACNGNPMVTDNSFELVYAEATIGNLGILYAQREVRFADNEALQQKLTRPLSDLPKKGMSLVMTKAVGVVYDKVCNLVAAEEFHPEVILGAFTVAQLARLGYDRELALKAVAFTDVASLLRKPNSKAVAEYEWEQALTTEAKLQRLAIVEGRTVEKVAHELGRMTVE